MSASRFPLAMSRDNLVHPVFEKVGRFNTPTTSIIATIGVMILLLVVFNVDEVAKLASSFKLLLFGLLNVAVIVMRESRIEEYDPGYKSPFYPWVQILGILTSFVLIFEMGLVTITFTVAVIIFSIAWYFYYASGKVDRQGAIYHVYERLGRRKDEGLEREMRTILQEKGLREEDPFEKAVACSQVIDLPGKDLTYEDLIEKVSDEMSGVLDISSKELTDAFTDPAHEKAIHIGENFALKHLRIEHDMDSRMSLVRFREGIQVGEKHFETVEEGKDGGKATLNGMIFLVSSAHKSTQHLRILAHLAGRIDSADFTGRWLRAEDEAELREILLRDERFINIDLKKESEAGSMIGKKVRELDLPGESLVTLIKRDEMMIFPRGDTELMENDEIYIIGSKDDIEELSRFT
jgi:mannitol/fructose-specific phosphotransferase system IIA component (Ntr-type)